LCIRYTEPDRAYHNLEHVLACLEAASSVRSELASPAEVELALWYHDAIYDPRRGDNEEESARFALEQLSAALAPDALASVSALILATKHASAPIGNDARFVVDIDLAILGAAPERFDAYEKAIRHEYGWVPAPIFRRKRREVLRGFLDRPRIYSTEHFRESIEAAARLNLTRSIARLS
jgi:predicted metal-dependent HD superfamily phosphohydrolase